MDLYTSKFGKLQKQKELAISQVARERQKAIDEKNARIRRGLGKTQSSVDLVNTVMAAGGTKITQMVTSQNQQLENSRELGRSIDQDVVVVGPDGVARYSLDSFESVVAAMDNSRMDEELAKNVVTNWNDILQVVENGPSPNNPSMDYNTEQAQEWLRNFNNLQE